MLAYVRKLDGEQSCAGSRKSTHQNVASCMTVTCCQRKLLPSSKTTCMTAMRRLARQQMGQHNAVTVHIFTPHAAWNSLQGRTACSARAMSRHTASQQALRAAHMVL